VGGNGIDGPVDVLESRRHGLAVLPGDEVQAVAQQVNDAGLHRRLRKDSGDRLRETLQPVDNGDQHVHDTAILQLIHDAQPEFGAFVLLEPEAQNFLGPVGALSTREIVGHLRDLYGIDVSPDLISAVTDAVLEEVTAWQARPLEATYPLIFFDALRVKIRDEGMVRNKAVHIALGVRADGTKEILGLWLEQNEGAKFWLRVLNELRNRGVEDILLAVVDGLKGFPEAIQAAFPETTVQS